MKKRVITSVVYVVVLIGLIALKWLVPGGWGAIGFDALFCAISVIGSFELLRAFKNISLPHKAVTLAFCAGIVPIYALAEITMGLGWLAALIYAGVFAIVIAVLYFTHYGESNALSTAGSFFAMFYCGVLSCVFAAVNHLPHGSTPAIILMFLTVMLTDGAAFVLGSALSKYVPYKLAPRISPRKTVIGGIGGLLGAIVAAIASYFIYYGLSNIGNFTVDAWTLVSFILIGFVASVAGQAGDLFESAIKRKCEIKDTGKLLPGHGGVLDRFDSMLFCGVVILLGFILLGI